MKLCTAAFIADVINRRTISAAALSRGRGWACSACRHGPLTKRFVSGIATWPASVAVQKRSGTTAFHGRRSYSSTGNAGSSQQQQQQQQRQKRRRRAFILTASGGAATAAVLAFTDDIKQSYETAERTGRVAAALVLCINDYRTTLNLRDKTEDAEERSAMLKACHTRCAQRTLRVLEKNGGIFIKLGQHLSAMNYLLPLEWTTTFVPLQDRCPVSSIESIEAMYRSDTGRELSADFSSFAREPVGAASLAQVHLATERATGRPVAVKVQHPSMAQWAGLDLALTAFTFSMVKRFFPEYDLEWLSSEMAQSLPQELDFRREADNAARTRTHFAAALPQLPLVVPEVVWARQRILVMARESGHRLDDLAYMDAHGIDRDAVSASLAHLFNEMVFGEGAPLHCDPHGGNLAIRAWPGPDDAGSGSPFGSQSAPGRHRFRHRPNFDIILYDHGLYRDIPLALRRSYAKMWLAVLDGDMARMQRYAHEVAGVDARSVPLFAAAITGRDFSVVRSAAILQPRTALEKDSLGGQLQDGLLADLVQLLARVPRIILLILKTNDLTRSLDESLHTRHGPIRSFLIMARYCLRTVRNEQLDAIRQLSHPSLLWPANAARWLSAWLAYLRGAAKLDMYDLWLRLRVLAGDRPSLRGLVAG